MTVTYRPPYPYDPADLHGPGTYEWEAAPAEDWQVTSGYRCRAGAGHGRKAHGVLAVARMNRGTPSYPVWFAYCTEHMRAMGQWIENGRVMTWKLRDLPPGDPG